MHWNTSGINIQEWFDMSEYKIVRQSVTVELVKPTLKERIIDGALSVLAVALGIGLAVLLAVFLN